MHRPKDGDGDRMTRDERFDELWTDFLEGELDAAGFDELEQLLASDPALARRAADLLRRASAAGPRAAARRA
jgi:anti-sigma factor RsiW